MKYYISFFLFTSHLLLWGQQKNKTDQKKWEYSFSIGLAGLSFNGIPVSQAHLNVANYYQDNGVLALENTIHSGTVVNGSIHYTLHKNKLGLILNNFLGTSDDFAAASDHYYYFDRQDTGLIFNYIHHRYSNLGLEYQREVLGFFNDKLKINLKASFGLSINRTPDRSEYDPYVIQDFNEYLEPDTLDGRIIYKYLERTDFRTGYFIGTGIKANYQIGKKIAVFIAYNYFWQNHEITRHYFFKPVNGIGENSGSEKYSIKNNQFTIGINF